MTQRVAAPIELTVVVPTYNERENIVELVRRLDGTLGSLSWEIIFVDDNSPDGTAEAVRALAREDRRVRLISRHNRRGLASAVVEGGMAAAADIVAVMDGDLQHDETILPRMFDMVASGQTDIASASRFLREGGADGLSSRTRMTLSNRGIRLANYFFNLGLSDPLTGFFVFHRNVLKRALPELTEVGYKILLDLITASHERPRIAEVPMMFRRRLHGESKLDARALYDFLLFIIQKKISRILPLPATFISLLLISGVGISVHMAVFVAALDLFAVKFVLAQVVAALAAVTFTYMASNALTYNDWQLKGASFFVGFFIFGTLCAVGILANEGIASVLHEQYTDTSYAFPALAGALIAAIWNGVAIQTFSWGQIKRLKMLGLAPILGPAAATFSHELDVRATPGPGRSSAQTPDRTNSDWV